MNCHFLLKWLFNWLGQSRAVQAASSAWHPNLSYRNLIHLLVLFEKTLEFSQSESWLEPLVVLQLAAWFRPQCSVS